MDSETPPGTPPLDAERQRLRAQGYSDTEISQILVARALGGGGSGTSSAPPHPPGMFSNVISSIVAVTGYAGGLFGSVRQDVATILDRSAAERARKGAFVAVAIKAVVIGVLAFAAWQEWQQHIVSAPQTAAIAVDLTKAQAQKAEEDAKVAAEVAAGQAAQARKAEADASVAKEVAAGQAADARKKEADAKKSEAEAEYAEELAKGQKAQACAVRNKQIAENLPPSRWAEANAQYYRDCDPTYAAHLKDMIASCDAKYQIVLNIIDNFEGEGSESDNKLAHAVSVYKETCPITQEQYDQSAVHLTRRLEEIKQAAMAPTTTPAGRQLENWLHSTTSPAPISGKPAASSAHARYLLMGGHPEAALKASYQSWQANPNDLPNLLISAHAQMILGSEDVARQIYLSHHGNVGFSKSWEQTIVGDFAEMRKNGMDRPLMTEIEQKFQER